MKDKIRQILREETTGFDENTLNALYQFMNFITKDYKWYYDTPKNRFEHSAGSIWLIIPETKKWMLELDRASELWFNHKFLKDFKRYFTMEESDFKKFIMIWVEDVLNRGVYAMEWGYRTSKDVEDVLKRGKELK